MNELFEKLKSSLSYLFPKKELEELTLSAKSTNNNKMMSEKLADEALLKRHNKLSDNQKERVVTVESDKLLVKAEEVSAKLAEVKKQVMQKSNETWSGYLGNKLFGIKPEQMKKLDQHEKALALLKVESNDEAKRTKIKELIDASFGAKKMISKLIDSVEQDLGEIEKSLQKAASVESKNETQVGKLAAKRINDELKGASKGR